MFHWSPSSYALETSYLIEQLKEPILMKASHALRLAALLNAEADKARLDDRNHSLVAGKTIDPATGAEKLTLAHDPASADIDIVSVLQQLDDEARQRMVDAINQLKAAG